MCVWLKRAKAERQLKSLAQIIERIAVEKVHRSAPRASPIRVPIHGHDKVRHPSDSVEQVLLVLEVCTIHVNHAVGSEPDGSTRLWFRREVKTSEGLSDI